MACGARTASGETDMNRRHCIAGIAAVTLAPACLAARAAASNERRWPAVQATLDAFVAERNAAGVGVGITFGDSPAAYPSAGTLAFDTAAAFDRDSICRIYSMTKNVTRIATLLLVEDGSSRSISQSPTCCLNSATCVWRSTSRKALRHGPRPKP